MNKEELIKRIDSGDKVRMTIEIIMIEELHAQAKYRASDSSAEELLDFLYSSGYTPEDLIEAVSDA